LDNKKIIKTWLTRIVFAVLIAEIFYVLLFNLALRLPATQNLINQIRPEKVHITWEKAWTWYPFRFHIENAAGNGQSRSQQWEFEVRSVAASIDVLPLIFKRVWINNVRVADASYHQRPRLKPDRDYSGQLDHFPPISGREITDAVTTPKKKKKPWHVDIENIRLDGVFSYWVHRYKGQARGTLDAELDVVSRGGLFSLNVPAIDLQLDPHYIDGVEMFRRGEISGELGFAPFVPRDNKGVKLWRYLIMDTDLDIHVNSLGFINVFTQNTKTMKTEGTGRVKGHLSMEGGHVLGGTELSVDADKLHVDFLSHKISGNGAIKIEVSPETEDQFGLDIRFEDMAMQHDGGGTPMFSGLGLKLNFRTAIDLFLTGGEKSGVTGEGSNMGRKPFELKFELPAARVADMSVFNHYFPASSPFRFSGGTADVTADILFKQDDTDGYLRVVAEDMEAQVDEQSIRTDFSADISVVNGTPRDLFFDISGTEIRLDNVEVLGEEGTFNQQDWATAITFNQAETIFTNPVQLKAEADLSMTDTRPIVAIMGNQKNRPKWIENMLTVEDVKGTVKLDMANDRILISDAFIDSDNIDFGAKGIIDQGLNNGVIYARYKKLDLVVKISDGKKNIDLIRARGKFDEYKPGALPR